MAHVVVVAVLADPIFVILIDVAGLHTRFECTEDGFATPQPVNFEMRS